MPGPAPRIDEDAVAHVAAPSALVYRLVTDLGAWGSWWPRVRVRPADLPDTHEVRVGRGPRAVRVRVEAHGWRHDVGVRLRLSGDLEGEAEWWLDPRPHGVVVHLRTAVRARSRRAARTWRRAARRGLMAATDRAELAVRLALGRAP